MLQTRSSSKADGRHLVLGVDIGGTFTDFVGSVEGEDGLFVHKRLTTHDDPTASVFAGLDLFEAERKVGPDDLLTVVHATTLATNLILEGKGARVALVTTRGFRDILTMRRESRYDDYDLELKFPEPLVPRSRRFELSERTLASGEIALAPSASDLREIAHRIADCGADAVAVCLLHAYVNPANEQMVAQALKEAGCRLPISLSSVVQPEIREYERCATTVVNACVQPEVLNYLARFEERLARKPYRTGLFIMQSNGAYADSAVSGELPARLVESGPAAGTIAAGYFSRQTQSRRTISFDMGGTTAKVATILDYAPEMARELEVARVHKFRKGSGIPLRCPSVELIEIGSGGGSIASLDSLRRLKVGPESAGSSPGPACYGRGGLVPTVTDADLVLGYLDPGSFPFPLDAEKAREAIQVAIAGPLGIDVIAAAAGIVEVVTEQMASATRIQLLEKGLDARDFTLVAFGGAGPVHACAMARRLGVRTIVYPVAAGVASAFGLLVAPHGSAATRTFIQRLDGLDEGRLRGVVAALQEETDRQVSRNGATPALDRQLALDMRYARQGYELSVDVPGWQDGGLCRERIGQLFADAYEEVFGRIVDGVPIEVVGVRLLAQAKHDSRVPVTVAVPDDSDDATGARRRPIWLRERQDRVTCDVLTRSALGLRGPVTGPLIVEDRETSIVIDSRATARIDEFGHVVVDLQ